jgi:hypothetical protein
MSKREHRILVHNVSHSDILVALQATPEEWAKLGMLDDLWAVAHVNGVASAIESSSSTGNFKRPQT